MRPIPEGNAQDVRRSRRLRDWATKMDERWRTSAISNAKESSSSERRVIATMHSVILENTDEQNIVRTPELSISYATELLRTLSMLEMLPKNKGAWIYEDEILSYMHDDVQNGDVPLEFATTLAKLFALKLLTVKMNDDGSKMWNLAPQWVDARKKAKRAKKDNENWLDGFVNDALKQATADATVN